MNTSTFDLQIEGMTGDREHDRAALAHLDTELLALIQQGVPADDPERRRLFFAFSRLDAISILLKDFRTAAPALEDEATARTARDSALHQVELRWEALNTAEHWHAAHHTWIVSVDAARAAITAWHETARAAFLKASAIDASLKALAKHQIQVPEQITLASMPNVTLADIDAQARELTDQLNNQHTKRTALAAETLRIAAH